jgi:hypothetical protein
MFPTPPESQTELRWPSSKELRPMFPTHALPTIWASFRNQDWDSPLSR